MKKQTKIYGKKFSPLDWQVGRSKLKLMKQYKVGMFNNRVPYPRADTMRTIQFIAIHLHYLTDHAPKPIQARWKQAGIRMSKRTRWWRAGLNALI